MRISDWSSDVCSSDLGADDEGSADLPPRRGKACRVLIFFLYFFGFVIAVPMIAIAIVQAKYGLTDGPPSFPADPFGKQVKWVANSGLFLWARMPSFIFGRVARSAWGGERVGQAG